MKIAHILFIFNVSLALIFCQSTVFAQDKFTIVLDAGHGGKDPGTVNGRNYEKDINLSVVKIAGEILEKNSNFRVVYTRKTDVFVELNERSNIAAREHANLFVSVHVNAAASKQAYGTETFIMGVHKNSANLDVARRENGVISLENNFSSKYEGYDPTSSESHIMFSLMQYAYGQESLELASLLQNSFEKLGRRNKGVKQAGFLVLWRNSMPSILTELGFLSNESEMKYLTSTKGQRELAESIAQSVTEYHKNFYGKTIEMAHDTPPLNTKPTQYEKKHQSAYFSVQVASSRQRLEINSENFGPLVMRIKEKKERNLYKYTVGELFLYKEALHLQSQIRDYIRGAFIVAFDKDGSQISTREAKKILNQ